MIFGYLFDALQTRALLKIYEDGSSHILKGCESCNSKFFFYVKDEQIKKMREMEGDFTDIGIEEKKQMEKDVREIAGFGDEEVPVFLDFESIKVIKPGKYVVDLANLFSTSKPRVYKLEDGKYIIDLSGVQKIREDGKVAKA